MKSSAYLDEMLRSRNLNELNCSDELLLIVKIGGVTYLLLIKHNCSNELLLIVKINGVTYLLLININLVFFK